MLYPVQPLPDLFRRGAFITDVAREGVEPLHTVEVGGVSAGYASCADDLVPVRVRAVTSMSEVIVKTPTPRIPYACRRRDMVSSTRVTSASGEQHCLPDVEADVDELFFVCHHG